MVSTDVVMNYFAPYQADYAETLEAGYPIINSYADWLYIVPEVGYGNHIPLSDLYAMWEVNNLGGGFSVPKSSPMLRGAEPCFWYDMMVGCSEFDIFNAVKKEMMLVCEKAWYGEPSEQHDLDDFIQRVDQLGNYAPNANPARYIVNHTDEDILLSYDVEQTEDERLEDRSGNGYDAMMHQVEIVKDGDDHVAKFDGSSYLTLPFDSVGFPYTVTFDLLIEEENDGAPDRRLSRADLRSLTVYGTREEFFADYVFEGEWEDAEPFGELHLQVRMRRIDGTTYGLLARGGGPLAYGLQPTDLTLESLESGE